MSVLTSLTRFSLRWSSARRALSVLALLLAAPGYGCKADQTSPIRSENETLVSSPVMNAPLMEAQMYLPLSLIGSLGITVYGGTNIVGAWGIGCLWCVVQILLEHGAVSLAGRWVGADTHTRMKEVQSRMSGRLPAWSCLWHMAVSAMAIWAYWTGLEAVSGGPLIKGLIILAGTCLAVGMRTLWLYIRARRERSHAEAAGKQQA